MEEAPARGDIGDRSTLARSNSRRTCCQAPRDQVAARGSRRRSRGRRSSRERLGRRPHTGRRCAPTGRHGFRDRPRHAGSRAIARAPGCHCRWRRRAAPVHRTGTPAVRRARWQRPRRRMRTTVRGQHRRQIDQGRLSPSPMTPTMPPRAAFQAAAERQAGGFPMRARGTCRDSHWAWPAGQRDEHLALGEDDHVVVGRGLPVHAPIAASPPSERDRDHLGLRSPRARTTGRSRPSRCGLAGAVVCAIRPRKRRAPVACPEHAVLLHGHGHDLRIEIQHLGTAHGRAGPGGPGAGSGMTGSVTLAL